MPDQLEGIVQRMIDAGEPEENIALVIREYSAPPPPPLPPEATIGMIQPSTRAGDPNVPGTAFGRQISDPALRSAITEADVMDAPLAPNITKAPGILARATGLSKARGGQNIQAGVQASRGAPVNVEGPGRVGMEMLDYQGIETIPRVAQSFMRRITDPTKGDLPVEEAQRFMSTLSRLSSGEFSRLTPNMQRMVTTMRDALRESLMNATGGRGGQYARGVREFRRASQAAKTGKKVGKTVGLGVGGLLSADYLLNRITSALQSTP